MKKWKNAIKICHYQIRTLRGNFKMFMVPLCLFLFMLNDLLPVRKFLTDVQENASPFLFPFLFNDVFWASLMIATAIPFFIDAPFYDRHQLYVVIRRGVSDWALGQIFYVLTVSALYMCFLVIMSLLLLLPHLSVSGEWGRIWTTLALTDACSMYGMSFGVSSTVIFGYEPWEAMLITFLLGYLICSFYGFCQWCLNLYVGKTVSLVVTLFSILLVTRVRFFPSWAMYLTPAGWADLSNLSAYASHGISVGKAVGMLVAGILVLSVVAYRKTVISDLAK